MKLLITICALIIALVCHVANATWCSLANVAIFFLYWLHKNKMLAVKYFQILFIGLFWLLGVFLCECTHIDLWEIDDFSYNVGAFPLASFFLIAFFSAVEIFDGIRNAPLVVSNDHVDAYLPWLCLILSVISIGMYAYVFNRPCFIHGIDRFSYNAELPQIIVRGRNVLQCVLPVVVVFSWLSNWSRKTKLLFIGLIVIPFVLFNIWTGYKFDIFFFLMFSAGCPIVLFTFRSGVSNFLNFRKIVLATAICSTLFATILVVQFKSYDNGDVFKRIVERIAQQGQLWWKVFSEHGKKCHCGEMLQECQAQLAHIGKKSIDGEYTEAYGIYKLMELTTPEDFLIAKLNSGSRYTSKGLELPYYYLGVSGVLIFAFVSAFGYTLLMNLYLRSLGTKSLISSILCLKLLASFDRACAMGEYNLLLGKDTIFFIVLLTGLTLAKHRPQEIGKGV